MPILHLEDAHREEHESGRLYQTLVGDDAGSTPVRVGIQTSPPGYSTGTHSHPYMEVVTVLDGSGEAWINSDDNVAAIGPGSTIVAPPNTAHGFRNTGTTPLRTMGVHASPKRITHRAGETTDF